MSFYLVLLCFAVGGVLSMVLFLLALMAGEGALRVLDFNFLPAIRFSMLVFRSLRRNLLRTSLMYVAVYVLVIMVTFIWSVLSFLDNMTSEKAKDFKAIVTEKWQVPSQMPLTYVEPLSRGAARNDQDVRPIDFMTWQFYGGSLEEDPKKRTRDKMLFFFCMDPLKLRPMMDDLDKLDEALVQKMAANDRGVILGMERRKKINKEIGEKFIVYSMNYPKINLEFEILGEFPEGRYNESAVMHWKYLQRALDDYQMKNKEPHPMAVKSLNLVWLRVPDSASFGQLAEQVESSVEFKYKPVRCETASSGIASWLDAYRDLIWGMRWLLSPSILVIMSLLIALAISIGVRERRTEVAVLKVLGYRPWMILLMVLGEALLVGLASGLSSAGITFAFINFALGGFKFPIAFFPAFDIPLQALWWGPTIGLLTAFLGSAVPAWAACRVKVAEVFAKVA